MSSPHRADVPVVDLDEQEDVFSGDRDGLVSSEDLNALDYEHNPAKTGIFGKFRDYFNPLNKPQAFEMSSSWSDSDFFNVSDSEDRPEIDDLRNYKVKRLNQYAKRIIFSFAVFLLVLYAFFSLHKKNVKLPSKQSIHTKRVLSNSTHDFYPTTIMISLDGFHPHYISPKNTPEMHKMMLDDFGAPFMIPSFPSSTFPNHWTLVTGLYPSEHGIVGNTFYDPLLQKQFINTNPKFGLDPEFWQGGEPLWATAHKQNVNAAVHMWPGSEVHTGDERPLEFDSFNGTELLTLKVDRILQWLDRGDLEKRPELILSYVPTIDQFGHKFGISGKELTDSIRYVDDFIALLNRELSNRNLKDVVNLVIVSDHGMAPTSNDRLLFLDDIIDLTKIEHIDGWPLFGLRPKSEHSVDEIYEDLQKGFESLSDDLKQSFHYYKLEDIPSEWNFGGNKSHHRFDHRLAPLWVIPNVGYSVTTHKNFEDNGYQYKPRGVHGYNNTELLMRALFLAKGPYFEKKLPKNQKKILPFANTNIYNMVCDSLDLIPAPNNGTHQGAPDFVLSPSNVLPQEWSDPLTYPNVPFDTDHIVEDATYDLLWRKPDDRALPTTVYYSTNKDPHKSLLSEEETLLSVKPELLPKPSDFTLAPTSGADEDVDEHEDEFEDDIESESEMGGEDEDKEHHRITFGDLFNDVGEMIGDVIDDAKGIFNDFYGNGNPDSSN